MKHLKRKDKFKKTAAVLMMAGVLGMTGCARYAGTDGPMQSESGTAGSTEESAAKESKAGEPNVYSTAAAGSADTMIEAGSHLYFRYGNDLFRLSREDDSLERLYGTGEGETCAAFWVYNNNLYFNSSDEEASGGSSALYKMSLSDKKIVKEADLPSAAASLYASDHILYVKYYDSVTAYALKEDGSIGTETPLSGTVYGKIPEGAKELYGEPLPYLLEGCGYMPLTNGENLVIADQNGQNVKNVPEITNTGMVLFARDAFYAMVQEEENRFVCKRFDITTLEPEILFETTEFPELMQYKNGKLYYMESGSYDLIGGTTRFYQVDVKTREKTSVAEMATEPGTSRFYSFLGGFYVTDDTVYCEQVKDYGVYLEKASLAAPEEKLLLKTPLYQSEIKELGTVEAETKKISSSDGSVTLAEVYVEKLVFAGNSEAVSAMNQVMEENFRRQLDYGGQMVDPDDKTVEEYTLTSQISSVTYLDNHYCCIEETGYEYTGGAHGMPFRDYYIFDRQTGKRLELDDLIETPERELKTLVSAAFREKAEKTQFAFESPEDLEKTVAEGVDYDSAFYMTREGLVFYYTPYDIASYAAGFPTVTIPYEKLDMKISL